MSWLALGLFLIPAGVLLIAVLERLIGCPIPQLRHSRPVPRRRVYWLVPLTMLVLTFTIVGANPFLLTCFHCGLRWPFEITLIVTTSLGWFFYYVILVPTSVKRWLAE